MRTESLCSAVSQILLEAQELMNAARSQCVAQQLQLHSTHYLTDTAPKMKIRGGTEAGMAPPSKTSDRRRVSDVTRRTFFGIYGQENVRVFLLCA